MFRTLYTPSSRHAEKNVTAFYVMRLTLQSSINQISRLNVDLLNSLVAKCKEEITELSQEVEAQKADMERQLESAAQEQAEFEKLESWADLYDNCTFEAKKMIVSQLIKAVYVYRDYRLEVEFRVSFDDFKRLCVGCEPNGGRITAVEST